MKTRCLNEERFADYLEGRLSENDRGKTEAHLSKCEKCLQEFLIGNSLVRGGSLPDLESVPARVTQAAVDLVKKRDLGSRAFSFPRIRRFLMGMQEKALDFFSVAHWAAWRLAPIRGSRRVVSENLVHLRKTFKEFETEIEIEKIGKSKAHVRVRLPMSNGRGKGLRVTLKKGEREVSSYLLDKSGYVLFEDIPFGHYNLTFLKDGVNIGTYRFEIKESLNG